jgi:hypothetical protein
MRIPLFCFAGLAALAAFALPAAAAAPTYTPQFLGAASHIDAMNESGEVVGWVSSGASRGFVAGPSHPYQLLPLPVGMVSSYANDINEAGVIVGAVGPSSSPEYYLGGRAASWTPDGAGGYTVTLLGVLPGHTASQATALNNVGDIVGYSFNGMFRIPVLFTPGGPTSLAATGIFDPADVNDQRVVVDHSATALRLDLDTMIVEDLGIPPGSYTSTWMEAVNESGVVVGAAILSTGSNCNREAARVDATGWQILSGCGQVNSAYDVNAVGDVIMQLNLAVWVDLAGFGAHMVQNLVSGGQWVVINAYGNALNDARQIAVQAYNPTSGESGALLLTPEAATAVAETGAAGDALRLSFEPNPFQGATTVRFDLPVSGRARLTVHDVAGRRMAVIAERVLAAGEGSVAWDGRDAAGQAMPAGVYFVRLEAANGVATQRVVKLR